MPLELHPDAQARGLAGSAPAPFRRVVETDRDAILADHVEIDPRSVGALVERDLCGDRPDAGFAPCRRNGILMASVVVKAPPSVNDTAAWLVGVSLTMTPKASSGLAPPSH